MLSKLLPESQIVKITTDDQAFKMLAAKIAETLDAMKEDGTFQKIFEESTKEYNSR